MKCELKKNANVNAKPVNAVLSAPVNAARILAAAAENILVKLKGPETLAPFFILGVRSILVWDLKRSGKMLKIPIQPVLLVIMLILMCYQQLLIWDM